MKTSFGPEEIDSDTLGRIEDFLHLREATDPDPRRVEAIRNIRAIREKFRDAVREDGETFTDSPVSEKLASVLSELASLERTSLGTLNARRVRSMARPGGIAEILDRYEKSRIGWDAGAQSDYAGVGPTFLRTMLGRRLRNLRETAGITVRQAAAEIRSSESKISRIELGRISIRELDILDLLRLYGIGSMESYHLLELAREANRPGWWQQYADILPAWFEPYLGLESAATLLRMYEPQYVPDLLQTSEYAAEVLSSTRLRPEDKERSLLIHKDRKLRLEKRRTHLWAIIDESVLHRRVGGKRVLLNQLRHLAGAAESPNVSLQVAPLNSRYVAGFPFRVLRFPEPDIPDIVYVCNLTSGLYLEKEIDIDQYQHAMEKMIFFSSEPDEAQGIIADMVKRIEHDATFPGLQ